MLRGSLPASWGGAMAALQVLDLSFCSLGGGIPGVFCFVWFVVFPALFVKSLSSHTSLSHPAPSQPKHTQKNNNKN